MILYITLYNFHSFTLQFEHLNTSHESLSGFLKAAPTELTYAAILAQASTELLDSTDVGKYEDFVYRFFEGFNVIV